MKVTFTLISGKLIAMKSKFENKSSVINLQFSLFI